MEHPDGTDADMTDRFSVPQFLDSFATARRQVRDRYDRKETQRQTQTSRVFPRPPSKLPRSCDQNEGVGKSVARVPPIIPRARKDLPVRIVQMNCVLFSSEDSSDSDSKPPQAAQKDSPMSGRKKRTGEQDILLVVGIIPGGEETVMRIRSERRKSGRGPRRKPRRNGTDNQRRGR